MAKRAAEPDARSVKRLDLEIISLSDAVASKLPVVIFGDDIPTDPKEDTLYVSARQLRDEMAHWLEGEHGYADMGEVLRCCDRDSVAAEINKVCTNIEPATWNRMASLVCILDEMHIGSVDISNKLMALYDALGSTDEVPFFSALGNLDVHEVLLLLRAHTATLLAAQPDTMEHRLGTDLCASHVTLAACKDFKFPPLDTFCAAVKVKRREEADAKLDAASALCNLRTTLDVRLKCVEEGRIFWPLYKNLEAEQSGFQHNIFWLLDAFKNGQLYTLALADTPAMDPFVPLFCCPHTFRVLPCLCVVVDNVCEIMWVATRLRRRGLATKFVDELRIAKVKEVVNNSYVFWSAVGPIMQRNHNALKAVAHMDP